jgi:hypothetical protein
MKIYKMNDKSDNFTIKKEHTFNLPMRMLMIGGSGCGKTGNLGNLLLRSDFYRDDFKPENIYIFSGSLAGGGDLKLMTIIETLEIPPSNLFFEFDEESAHLIYDQAVKNYNEAISEKRTPEHVLFVFDDLGYTNLQNKNKKNSILDKITSNGRKFLISIISLNQRITQLNTNAREQASGIILWSTTNKQLQLIEQDFNYLPSKKQFLDMVHKHTSNSKHDFIVMNLGKKNKYFNKEFRPICNCKNGSNKCGGDINAPE